MIIKHWEHYFTVTSTKATIGDWTFYNAENEQGKFILKVSKPLDIKDNKEKKKIVEKIKSYVARKERMKVPLSIKSINYFFELNTSKLVIVYPDMGMQIFDDTFSNSHPPEMFDSLWHMGVRMAHYDNWKGFGIADILIDDKGKWWPSDLNLNELLPDFEFDNVTSEKKCKLYFFKKLELNFNQDWQDFNSILTKFINPYGIHSAQRLESYYTGTANHLSRLYAHLYHNSSIPSLFKDNDSVDEKYQSIIKNNSIKNINNYHNLDTTKFELQHEWFNGYFWEPVQIFYFTIETHISPIDPRKGHYWQSEKRLDFETLTGFSFPIQEPIRNREDFHSIDLPQYDSKGHQIKPGSKVTIGNAVEGTVKKYDEYGRLDIDFEPQMIHIRDID